MKEALLWEGEGDNIRCSLCSHRCLIPEGARGACELRENQGGNLYSLVYGKLVAQHVDPIEKKPLYHFYPGHRSFSIASVGCNFRCQFCQNADIAQLPHDHGGEIAGDDYTARDVVKRAVESDSLSIAYTYTEPTVWYEFTKDCGELAREKGLKNVYVSNGYMTKEMLEDQDFIDAANIDLKSFNDRFYRETCGASLEPVMETLRYMKERDIWLEVTTLVIPGKNDSDDELRQIAEFISSELGRDVPWHLSAFHPAYRMLDVQKTPLETLVHAYDIGKEAGIEYIYIGNIESPIGRDTICPNCHETLIERGWFEIYGNRISDGKHASKITEGKCPNCGRKIAGRF